MDALITLVLHLGCLDGFNQATRLILMDPETRQGLFNQGLLCLHKACSNEPESHRSVTIHDRSQHRSTPMWVFGQTSVDGRKSQVSVSNSTETESHKISKKCTV